MVSSMNLLAAAVVWTNRTLLLLAPPQTGDREVTSSMQSEDFAVSASMWSEDRPAPAVSSAVRGDHVRILLIDDHPVFGDGVRLLAQSEDTFEIVAQAVSCASALALTRLHDPDLILLDVELPDGDGLDVVTRLRRICPQARIAVLTGHSDEELLMRALQLDVHGFLHKDMPGSALLAAMRALANGERVIGQPKALSLVLTEFGHVLRERERIQSGLTDREIEILRLAATGLNSKEIGARQFWSEITVKRKMQQIYRKLDVKSRAQAVAEAMRLGYI
jgi:DNA-binding NarL/FixJ family response regulator